MKMLPIDFAVGDDGFRATEHFKAYAKPYKQTRQPSERCFAQIRSVVAGYRADRFAFGMTPSCCIRLMRSNCPRNSAILPSAMR
jgi:hypothetical protein